MARDPRNYRHGHKPNSGGSPEYIAWLNIKARCNNANGSSFARYGGRGIKVCRRWVDSFEAFFEDMGPRPSPAHSIERKNNNGNYTKSNCRWATDVDQANNRRSNKRIKYKGEEHTVAEWARIVGIKKATLHYRLRNAPVAVAFEAPIQPHTGRALRIAPC